MLAVGNCYVAVCSAAKGASAPCTGEESGGGISWRSPARLQLAKQVSKGFNLHKLAAMCPNNIICVVRVETMLF